jgi:hypothetical protein
MSNFGPNARVQLLDLLLLRLGKDISHDEFRIEVEGIYNFQLDHRSISKPELDALERLFDVVARYSPDLSGREAYPGVYNDETQVDNGQSSRESSIYPTFG